MSVNTERLITRLKLGTLSYNSYDELLFNVKVFGELLLEQQQAIEELQEQAKHNETLLMERNERT
jgi:sugar diacid utilization regulator